MQYYQSLAVLYVVVLTTWPNNPTGKSMGLRCPVCTRHGHVARTCLTLTSNPLRQQNPARQSDPKAIFDNKICKIFNNKGSYFRGTRCPYFHVCIKCKGGHPKQTCPDRTKCHAHKSANNMYTTTTAVIARLLTHFPDQTFVSKLIQSLTLGFDIRYTGRHAPLMAPNLCSVSLHPDIIDDALAKEVHENRIVGPYVAAPLPNLRCSGLGVVPKKDGGWHLIKHLSAPIDSSINDCIDPSTYSLHEVP